MSMKNALFLCCLFFSVTFYCQDLNSLVEAKIDLSLEGEQCDIIFSANNKDNTNKSLKYRAAIIRSQSEVDNFEESNYFLLDPLQRKNITSTSILLNKKERVVVFILIYEEDKIISKDRVVINGFDGEDKLKPVIVTPQNLTTKTNQKNTIKNSDPNLMTGLVIEDTKTKPGRDFYRDFYLSYSSNNIKGDKVVKVSESLAIGGNTQIKIYVGDELVVQFFVNPRASFIKQMAEQSVGMVYNHFQQKKNIKEDLIRY